MGNSYLEAVSLGEFAYCFFRCTFFRLNVHEAFLVACGGIMVNRVNDEGHIYSIEAFLWRLNAFFEDNYEY